MKPTPVWRRGWATIPQPLPGTATWRFAATTGGAKYVIGAIKDLEMGDTITYTTIYGTRTYEVVLVKTIASTDWSYLQATADNRITITTCLANQPSKRVCVQAVEVDR